MKTVDLCMIVRNEAPVLLRCLESVRPRGAERAERLIQRFALRFDPPSRADFYTSLAQKVDRLRDAEVEFIHGDDVPKKRPMAKASEDAARKPA